MDFKKELAKSINHPLLDKQQVEKMLTIPPSIEMGDYCLPCFSLAKIEKKAPSIIAETLQKGLAESPLIEKTDIAGGYLNFYLNRQYVARIILQESKNEDFYRLPAESDKVVCIEYSSPNLAKFLHIGHYNCTIYGEAIARLYEFYQHKVIRLNYVGDYGTPFGKMVVAYLKWGTKEDILQRGLDAIQELYIKFNQKENEELLNQARAASKKIEDKEGQEYEIYKWFIEISIEKIKDMMAILQINFDDWRGESTYNLKLKEITRELLDKGIATLSQNAVIVDLNDVNLGIAVVERSDGGSLYITRDLAAIADRYSLYKFDKHIYVTANQQDSHFEKVIEICKRMGRAYYEKLQHISYGMFSTPEGKIASRKGKQAILEDILAEAVKKAGEIIKERNFEIEKKENVALEIAKASMAFSIFKVEADKDKVFDIENAISFDGDTAPYIQYTYARCKSLLRKGSIDRLEDFSVFENTNAFNILKSVANFKNTIYDAYVNAEPCFIARALLDIAKNFNSYYAENAILKSEQQSERLALANLTANTIKLGLKLLCINVLEEM